MVIFTFFGKIFTFIYRKTTVIELTYGTVARGALCSEIKLRKVFT